MALGRLLGRQFHHRSDAAVGSEGEPRMHYTLGVLLPLERAATDLVAWIEAEMEFALSKR